MKKYLAFFLMLFLIDLSFVYTNDNYVSVSYIEQSDLLRFVDFVQLTINSESKNTMEIQIQKSLLPLSPIIDKTLIAYKKNDKYVFTFIDGFGNRAYGYIKILSSEIIEFFIDCKEFTDEGKDSARLYGDVYLLTKSNQSIDPEIFNFILMN